MRSALLLILASAWLAGCGSDAWPESGSKHQEPGSETPDPGGNTTLNDGPQNLKNPGSGGSGGVNAGAGGSGGTAPATGTTLPAECLSWSPNAFYKEVSISDSNGMAEATRAREQIHLGFSPAPNSIRSEDFFNYYRIDLTAQNPTAPGGPVVQLELKPREIPNQYDLYVGVQAPKLTSPVPTVLTILVDTTPSMAGVAIERAGYVLEALDSRLQKGDVVSVLTTDPAQGSLSFAVGDSNHNLKEAEAFAKPTDTGNFGEALAKAYDLAQRHKNPAAWNRVLVLSDGAEPEAVLDAAPIQLAAQQGILLTAVSTAAGTRYYDHLLSKATALGRGAYIHIDSQDEAQRMFGERFDEVMGVAYDDVHVQLALPWFLHVIDEPATTQGANGGSTTPQPLAPGATLSLLAKLRTCSESLVVGSQLAVEVDVTYALPGQPAGAPVPTFATLDTMLTNASPELDKAVALRSYVTALSSVNRTRVEAAIQSVNVAEQANPADTSLGEIKSILLAHPVLAQQ